MRGGRAFRLMVPLRRSRGVPIAVCLSWWHPSSLSASVSPKPTAAGSMLRDGLAHNRGIAPPSARKKKILLPAPEVARRIAELLLFGVGRRRKFLYSLARSRARLAFASPSAADFRARVAVAAPSARRSAPTRPSARAWNDLLRLVCGSGDRAHYDDDVRACLLQSVDLARRLCQGSRLSGGPGLRRHGDIFFGQRHWGRHLRAPR